MELHVDALGEELPRRRSSRRAPRGDVGGQLDREAAAGTASSGSRPGCAFGSRRYGRIPPRARSSAASPTVRPQRRGRHNETSCPRRELDVLAGGHALVHDDRAELGPHGRRRGRAPRARGNAPYLLLPKRNPASTRCSRCSPPLRGRAGRRRPARRASTTSSRAIPPRGHPHAAPSPRPARRRRALTRSGPGTRRLSGNHGGCGERGAASGVLAPPSCGVPSGTPRRSSLRLPLSLPARSPRSP